MRLFKSALRILFLTVLGGTIAIMLLGSMIDGSFSDRMMRNATFMDVLIAVYLAGHVICAVIIHHINSLRKRMFPEDFSDE